MLCQSLGLFMVKEIVHSSPFFTSYEEQLGKGVLETYATPGLPGSIVSELNPGYYAII